MGAEVPEKIPPPRRRLPPVRRAHSPRARSPPTRPPPVNRASTAAWPDFVSARRAARNGAFPYDPPPRRDQSPAGRAFPFPRPASGHPPGIEHRPESPAFAPASLSGSPPRRGIDPPPVRRRAAADGGRARVRRSPPRVLSYPRFRRPPPRPRPIRGGRRTDRPSPGHPTARTDVLDRTTNQGISSDPGQADEGATVTVSGFSTRPNLRTERAGSRPRAGRTALDRRPPSCFRAGTSVSTRILDPT
ncbi:MAG: hypothetical protein JWM27_261 [Gemmatimonadetes bacterium]|nr:hypothetical protein [Gemmatimonadota bacterium]